MQRQMELDRAQLVGEIDLLKLRLDKRGLELQAQLTEERMIALHRNETGLQKRQQDIEQETRDAIARATTEAQVAAIRRGAALENTKSSGGDGRRQEPTGPRRRKDTGPDRRIERQQKREDAEVQRLIEAGELAGEIGELTSYIDIYRIAGSLGDQAREDVACVRGQSTCRHSACKWGAVSAPRRSLATTFPKENQMSILGFGKPNAVIVVES